MSRLEEVANVVLRVPSIILLDLLYRWDVQKFTEPSHPTYEMAFFRTKYLWNVYYMAHLLCAVLLMLPLRYLVKMYLYLLTALLLYVAHQTARDYIRQELDAGYPGAVYEDPTALTRIITALTGLVMVITLCSLLMKTRHAWLFASPILPLLARVAGLPLHAMPLLNTFSVSLTLLEVFYVTVSNLGVLLGLFKNAYQEVVQVLELYRLVALGLSLWTQLAVPMLFLVFWLVMFSLQMYSFLFSKPGILGQQGLIFIFLNSVSECCGTPYSLTGLTFTVSYLALGTLNLCKFYLLGYGAFQNGNVMHRGVTEGVTLMLLALQTGLLDLQVLQRTFLLSIILFIVVTSTLQSMIEIADPIVLALGATRNRSPWKHFRGISMCVFLLVFPCFMACKISHFFHMDFWLLILVSSCMLTSLQVLGTLFIYALFMVELFQDSRMEKMDEIIYCVNAVSRVLEFLVAVCVVAYGTWESIFGEWSWMGVSVIIVHSYFNVWLRAQSGWKSFLLRREAAKKISSLPKATKMQLRVHNDVCAICFQEMSVAVITPCCHFFHGDCLRKWLYVQDTCPLCHQQVTPPASKSCGGGERGEEEEDYNEESEEAAAADPEEMGGDADDEDKEGNVEEEQSREKCHARERGNVEDKRGADAKEERGKEAEEERGKEAEEERGKEAEEERGKEAEEERGKEAEDAKEERGKEAVDAKEERGKEAVDAREERRKEAVDAREERRKEAVDAREERRKEAEEERRKEAGDAEEERGKEAGDAEEERGKEAEEERRKEAEEDMGKEAGNIKEGRGKEAGNTKEGRGKEAEEERGKEAGNTKEETGQEAEEETGKEAEEERGKEAGNTKEERRKEAEEETGKEAEEERGKEAGNTKEERRKEAGEIEGQRGSEVRDTEDDKKRGGGGNGQGIVKDSERGANVGDADEDREGKTTPTQIRHVTDHREISDTVTSDAAETREVSSAGEIGDKRVRAQERAE
ncbi:RING finger protein 145-like isoform X2 [Ascaphus truei]|uniref:RING finger protein 145-like isoform X2 n=1 Tax=Ascaphus truei TaxID=8439 RepID=UPI003F5A1F0D